MRLRPTRLVQKEPQETGTETHRGYVPDRDRAPDTGEENLRIQRRQHSATNVQARTFPHEGECPAASSKCSTCCKIGRYSKMCSHKRKQVKAVEAQEDISDEDYCTAPCIMVGTVAPHKYATIHFKDTDFPCIIDTWAQVSVMAQTTYKLLRQPNLLPPRKKLFPYCEVF